MEYILKSQHFESYSLLPPTEKIGQKAKSLLLISKEQTPPFIIISTDLFQLWKKCKADGTIQIFINTLVHTVNTAHALLQQYSFSEVIARSSATIESLDERGIFDSMVSSNEINAVIENVKIIYEEADIKIQNSDNPVNELAILLQGYIRPLFVGHLSNERRISKTGKAWVVEYSSCEVGQKEIKLFPFNVDKVETKDYPYPPRLFEALKNLATSKTKNEIRYHFEWIWDNKQLHIVQQDTEDSFRGTAPGSEWKIKERKIKSQDLFVIVKEKDAINQWSKANHVKTFRKCDLPHGDIYILENPEIIKEITNSKISTALQIDLHWLIQYPIVIRTSLKIGDNNRSNLLLPRTHTLFSYEEAIKYLKQYAIDFAEQGLTENDFAFLIHRFILSKSCAFSFAKPKDSRVKIDSSWGFADGLSYNPYDSFIATKDKIQKRITCKSEYLDVDENGNWLVKRSGANWDWKPSLTKDEVLHIRDISLKIANYLNKEVIIMFFINDSRSQIHPAILPWHYSVKEIPNFAKGKGVSDYFFKKEKFIISKRAELEVIEKELEQNPGKKYYLKLKLDVDSVRNVDFLEKVAAIANKFNCPVELEGSILAHAFYILSSKGVHIKFVDYFEPEPLNKLHFNKLVRDKIPQKIESHGEVAKTIKLPTSKLVSLLKIKAIEEAFELFSSLGTESSIEELADILEVVRALCKPFGITFEELNQIADRKKAERGGFEEGIFLEETNVKSLINLDKDVTNERTLIDLDNSDSNKKDNLKRKYRNNIIVDYNEVTIPYIPSIENQKPFNIEGINANAIVRYSSQGIKIIFRKKKEFNSDPNQLNLFNLD